MTKRMTDAEFEQLLDDDSESGGAGYSDIVREARRARKAEAALLKKAERLAEKVKRLEWAKKSLFRSIEELNAAIRRNPKAGAQP